MKKVIYLQKTILFYHYSVYFKSYFYYFVNSYIFQLKTFYLFKIKLIKKNQKTLKPKKIHVKTVKTY